MCWCHLNRWGQEEVVYLGWHSLCFKAWNDFRIRTLQSTCFIVHACFCWWTVCMPIELGSFSGHGISCLYVEEECGCRDSWSYSTKNARKSLRPFWHNSRLDSSPVLKHLLSCLRILTVTPLSMVLIPFSLISVLHIQHMVGTLYIYIYIYIWLILCAYLSVCVCVCVCAWQPMSPRAHHNSLHWGPSLLTYVTALEAVRRVTGTGNVSCWEHHANPVIL